MENPVQSGLNDINTSVHKTGDIGVREASVLVNPESEGCHQRLTVFQSLHLSAQNVSFTHSSLWESHQETEDVPCSGRAE